MTFRSAAGAAAVTSVAAVLLTLGAGAAQAAPAASTAPSLAGTTQTLNVQFGDQSNTSPIAFKASTWKLKAFPDKGTYAQQGKGLTLTTTGKGPDKGCAYTGSYVKSAQDFEGTFACPDAGASGTFQISAPTG